MTDTQTTSRRTRVARRGTPTPLPEEEFGDRLHEIVTLRQCPDVERNVLGAVILNPTLWYSVAGTITEEDFGDPKHALVFKAIAELIEAKTAVTFATIAERLGTKTQAIGGVQVLHEMMSDAPTGAYIESLVKVLAQTAAIRRIQRSALDVLVTAAGGAYDDVLARVSRLEEAAAVASSNDDLEGLDTIVPRVFERIEQAIERPGGVAGRTFGLRDLTAVLGGATDGQNIIIAGRPAMGKTSAVVGFVDALVSEAKERGEEGVGLFFSLEMPKVEIGQKLISQRAQVSESMIRTNQLNQDRVNDLTDAGNAVYELPVRVADQTFSIEGVRAACHRARLKYGKVLVVAIDYLQLMRWDGAPRNANREAVISEISRRLKALAKELGCPFFVLSQLSRECEKRNDKRPMLADLRESGAIEQDADVVMFVYRDEVYNKNTEDRGIAEFIIAKQRHGPCGRVRARFHGPITRFVDLPSPEDGLRDFDGPQGAIAGDDGAKGDDHSSRDMPAADDRED